MLRRDADIVSPVRVFGLVWCLVFGLANLKLSALQFTWSMMDWIVALMGPASFLVGAFIAYVLNLDVPLRPLRDIRQIVRNERIRHRRLFIIILVAFITYVAGFATILFVKGYVPIFTPNPAAARSEYYIFGIGLFIHHMPVILFFAFVYHITASAERFKRRIIKIIVAVTLLSYFFLLQRYQLIMIAVMAFTLLYYASNRITFRSLLLFAGSGVLIVYSIASLRVGKIIEMVLYSASRMRFSPKYAIITEPYMYIAMNVENLVHAAKSLELHTYGYYTFDFLLAAIGLKYPLKEYFGLVEYPYLTSGYNTYTLFWTFYRDFGFPGISILPLIGGLAVGLVYYRMRQRPTLGLVTAYSIIVFIMSLSFFLSPLGFLWFVYFTTLTAIVWRLIRPNIRSNWSVTPA
jgi:oligosaccharide repeat unit polymerase